MTQFKVSALDVCNARFPVRLPSCEASLPTSCCKLRGRQELCGALSMFCPMTVICVSLH